VIADIFQLQVLVPWVIGMAFGIFVGGMPGLTATMAVALIIPATYYLTPLGALAMILGIEFTAIFAGDIPATFLRIPGTPASGAAVLDGYEMAKRGEGEAALGIDLVGSAVGGLIGVALLIFTSRPLATFALRFSNFEYFWLGVFGLSMSAIIARGNTLRGFISVLAGLLISCVGADVTTGYPRFSFGVPEFAGRIEFIPVMIGLFGLSEVFRFLNNPLGDNRPAVTKQMPCSLTKALRVLWRFKATVLKSSIVGTFIGALPGTGADVAAWVAYGVGKRTSAHPEKYGTGYEEGVVAPTAANNAALGGTWIPALVFGVPGDTITAIVLGAMLMYGLRPGPTIFQDSHELLNGMFAVAVISQFILVAIGYAGIKAFALFLRLPRAIVMATVVALSVLGSYALRSSTVDIYIMLGAGLLGFIMEGAGIPLTPMVLGLILGPMVEDNLRVGLIKTGGSLIPFLTRPICAGLIVCIFAALFGEPLIGVVRRLVRRPNAVRM
jgi:TctA family transporter